MAHITKHEINIFGTLHGANFEGFLKDDAENIFGNDGDHMHSLDLNFDEFLQSESADISPIPMEAPPVHGSSDVLHQLHGGHDDNFPMENRQDTSPQHNGYTSDGSYAQYPQHKKSHGIEDYPNNCRDKRLISSPPDQSYSQYKHKRPHPDSSPESAGSEPCSSPHESRGYLDSNRYVTMDSHDHVQRHRLYHQQQQSLHTLPGGSSPSGDSTCSHQSGASISSSRQLSPHDGQVQMQQHEFEKAMDTLQTSNSRAMLHSLDPTLGGNQLHFHPNGNLVEQQQSATPTTNFHSSRNQPNPILGSDIHNVGIPGSHSVPTQSQVVDPLMLQYLSSQISGPSAKKRKHSASQNILPEPLNAGLLSQQYQMMHSNIKQEPGLTSPTGPRGYINDAYEMNDVVSRHHGNIQRSLGASSSIPVTSLTQLQGGIIPSSEPLQRQHAGISTSGSHYVDNSSYQVIKWSRHQNDIWCRLADVEGKELPTMSYRVDADKGFNFAVPDDTFVCQKKNHFQVTVHIGVEGHPHFIKTDEGLKNIDAFYLDLYGVKYESINQTISIEQSQSDRSKKSFHPVKVDLPGDQVTKVTVGRLHFSETTANNMRKKGRPNPDQRYFMCVVALKAQAQGKSYMICASHTEKIIVRASNPGQFDSDDVQWQRAQVPEAIFHNGKVGINYDKPDEALVVHGNLKVTGRVMQPSDIRAKEDIQEVDPKEQLKNVQNIRIVRYKYTPEYCQYAGIDPESVTTGVLAQEFRTVLPSAVKDTGDVKLENGCTIPNFLVVDKEQLFMENIGAVQALSDLSNNFESRIDQLERWNKKLAKLKKYDSIRSTASSMFSGISNISQSTNSSAFSRAGSYKERNHNYKVNKRNSGQRSSDGSKKTTRRDNRQENTAQDTNGFGCFNRKLTQGIVLSLMLVMLLSFITMATLYAMTFRQNHSATGCTDSTCNVQKPQKSASGPSSSSVPWRSTTISKTPGTSASTSTNTVINGIPVAYCPGDETECGSDVNYCCKTNDPGEAFFLVCLRDNEESVFPQPTSRPVVGPRTLLPTHKAKKPRSHYPSKSQSSDDMHKENARQYTSASFEQMGSSSKHRHSRLRTGERHNYKKPRKHYPKPKPTSVTTDDNEHGPYSVSPIPTNSIKLEPTTKDRVENSTTSAVTYESSQKERKVVKIEKISGRPDFDTTKVPYLEKANKEEHDVPAEDIDERSEDEIDDFHRPEISKEKKRSRRSTTNDNDSSDLGLQLFSARIMEPNQLLFKNGVESGYVSCIDNENMTFNIPVSSVTPPHLPMTVEFNTTKDGYIKFCNFSSIETCPEVGSGISDADNVDAAATRGATHRFKINFASFISSDYWFYMGEEDNEMCSLSPKDFEGKYSALHLRFYRPCKSEMGQNDSPDSEPVDMMQSNDGQEQESLDQLNIGDLDNSISE